MFSQAERELAAYAGRNHNVFTREQALEFGMSEFQADRRRADRRWVAVHDEVFQMAGVHLTWKGKLLAATLAATPPVAISHRAGIGVYGLPGGRRDLVELSCKRWKRTKKSGLVAHESTRFTDDDIKLVDGIPVSTPERLMLEMAGIRPQAQYIERLVQAARRKRLITYDTTLETLSRLRRRGARGVRVLEEVLELWRPDSRPTASEMETRLLQVLRAAGLPDPIVQFDVLDEFGNLVATADLGMPWWDLVLEYDSIQEHSDEFQIRRGENRRNEIEACGYRMLVVRWGDLQTGGKTIIDQIERIARRHAS
jgi:hypothetical protein